MEFIAQGSVHLGLVTLNVVAARYLDMGSSAHVSVILAITTTMPSNCARASFIYAHLIQILISIHTSVVCTIVSTSYILDSSDKVHSNPRTTIQLKRPGYKTPGASICRYHGPDPNTNTRPSVCYRMYEPLHRFFNIPIPPHKMSQQHARTNI